MKIAGITRIRNEAGIIENTLNHLTGLLAGVYVYDDCSTDDTVAICEAHPLVKKVIRGMKWDSTTAGRNKAEGSLRQVAYEAAVADGADWVYCFDADEYVMFRSSNLRADAYHFRLFDFYITEEDKHKSYLNRKWMGPEFRDIPMLFKVNPQIRFSQRIPRGIGNSVFGGYVKHYGKAISVEEWEKDVKYYSEIRWKGIHPHLQKRWADRKGKAIHVKSDFGRELIQWNEKDNQDKIVRI